MKCLRLLHTPLFFLCCPLMFISALSLPFPLFSVSQEGEGDTRERLVALSLPHLLIPLSLPPHWVCTEKPHFFCSDPRGCWPSEKRSGLCNAVRTKQISVPLLPLLVSFPLLSIALLLTATQQAAQCVCSLYAWFNDVSSLVTVDHSFPCWWSSDWLTRHLKKISMSGSSFFVHLKIRSNSYCSFWFTPHLFNSLFSERNP